MTERLRLRLDLMLTFMRIGFFTFGGGYAMIPLIEETCVNKKGWITADEMVMIAAVAESTPGPISINCATYVGYRQAGFSGALWATFGMVLPSFLVIYLISMFRENFLEITVVANAFRGIQIAVGLLILDAGDDQEAQTLMEGLEQHVADQTASYASYLPGEVYKLENAILERYGNYVILCVAADAAAAQSVIDGYVK